MYTFEETRPTYSRCLVVTLLGWLIALAGMALGAGRELFYADLLAGLGTVVGVLAFLRGIFVPIPQAPPEDPRHAHGSELPPSPG